MTGRKFQHPVPEPLLARFGDITVSFALLESTIQQLVGSLIGQGQRIGQIVAVELPFRGLLPLAENLYRERHAEDGDFADLQGLMKRADAVNARRNQITHSVWAAGQTKGTITRIKATAKKGGLHFAWEYEVTEEALGAVADEIKVLANDVQRYWMRLIESGKLPNN